MSKIVSPVPPLADDDGRFTPDLDAQWWRFCTVPNRDGYHYVVRTNATEDPDDKKRDAQA